MKTELNFASKIENISCVEKLVDDISAKYNLDSDLYGNMLVAIVEAVNNAILHGNKLNENKKVNLNLNIEDCNLTIRIKDEGNGFDFNSIADPTLPENIEKPHGRGIFLMNHLADGVKYFDNGTGVELNFKI